MYTHTRGYKFCIGVDANGSGMSRGESIIVDLWAMPGEYDHQLEWPAEVKFTIELINQQSEQNALNSSLAKWNKPTCSCHIRGLNNNIYRKNQIWNTL